MQRCFSMLKWTLPYCSSPSFHYRNSDQDSISTTPFEQVGAEICLFDTTHGMHKRGLGYFPRLSPARVPVSKRGSKAVDSRLVGKIHYAYHLGESRILLAVSGILTSLSQSLRK